MVTGQLFDLMERVESVSNAFVRLKLDEELTACGFETTGKLWRRGVSGGIANELRGVTVPDASLWPDPRRNQCLPCTMQAERPVVMRLQAS